VEARLNTDPRLGADRARPMAPPGPATGTRAPTAEGVPDTGRSLPLCAWVHTR
jgi:hypothetical protein